MEPLGKITRFPSRKPKTDPHLHSPAHVLADELSEKLRDRKHFGFYLKMALLYDHIFLRRLLGQVLESKNVKSPGRLFAFLIKKYNPGSSRKYSNKNQSNNIKIERK